jgi:hypothetical protein
MSAAVAIPPSALPGISPSRGEIGKRHILCLKQASSAEDAPEDFQAKRALHPISPLEGEMSGRTEGGELHPLPSA